MAGPSAMITDLARVLKHQRNIQYSCADPERGWDRESGPHPQMKNHNAKGFLSNAHRIHQKNHKRLGNQHSISGHHLPASETPSNGVSLVDR